MKWTWEATSADGRDLHSHADVPAWLEPDATGKPDWRRSKVKLEVLPRRASPTIRPLPNQRRSGQRRRPQQPFRTFCCLTTSWRRIVAEGRAARPAGGTTPGGVRTGGESDRLKACRNCPAIPGARFRIAADTRGSLHDAEPQHAWDPWRREPHINRRGSALWSGSWR